MLKRFSINGRPAFLSILLAVHFLLSVACWQAAVPPSAGHLAYIGGDGNVYVVEGETLGEGETVEKTAVTTDSESANEGAGLSYHRLAWSPAGQLAYASVVRHRETAKSKLFVLEEVGGESQVVGESDSHFVIYNYWNPASCNERCTQFAYLIEEEADISLRLVDLADEMVSNERLGQGWPFYFSWSPNGRSILGHVGRAKQDDPQQRLVEYEIATKTAIELLQSTGKFIAPAWSPAGGGWTAVLADGETAQLVLQQADEQQLLATASNSQEIAFNWSPDGSKIAFMIRGQENDPFYGGLQLYDLESQTTRSLTAPSFHPLAFFWSPNSKQLAYLAWIPLGNNDWAQWRVVDLETGRDRGFQQFHPTPAMRFVLDSFNQYGQSHRLWSPNGRYLVYAERDFTDIEAVWLVDTWAESGTEPILIDEGSLAFWSWE
ncbi:MAG: hypothetical protein AAF614_26735 [Chloroflexota bacterium]